MFILAVLFKNKHLTLYMDTFETERQYFMLLLYVLSTNYL